MMRGKKFEKEIKVAYMMNYTKLIVYLFLAYEKHCKISTMKFHHIVNEALNSGYILDDNDLKLVVDESKKILRTTYGIEILAENPIEIKKVLG